MGNWCCWSHIAKNCVLLQVGVYRLCSVVIVQRQLDDWCRHGARRWLSISESLRPVRTGCLVVLRSMSTSFRGLRSVSFVKGLSSWYGDKKSTIFRNSRCLRCVVLYRCLVLLTDQNQWLVGLVALNDCFCTRKRLTRTNHLFVYNVMLPRRYGKAGRNGVTSSALKVLIASSPLLLSGTKTAGWPFF